MTKRLSAALAAFAFAFATSAWSQAWPAKPIRLIVPLQPGGLADGFARMLGMHLQERLGQTVIVENRPGGSQVIAGEALARAAPDGYTLGLATETGLVLSALAQKAPPYDPVKDFTPITLVFSVPYYIVVNPSVPGKNLQEVMAHAKSGKMSYASFGPGSSNHIGTELLKNHFKVDMVHIPYKGTAQAMTDLLAGQVQFMMSGGQTAFPLIKSGKLRVIAVSSLKSSPSMPDLPTVVEQGVPGYDLISWFGLLGPARLPPNIVGRLNRETVALLKSKATVEKYAAFGIDMTPSSPKELADRIRNDGPFWAKAMSEAGIRAE
jgi:tripartite-type tricarboxylate transporter receptor subunit TctC